MDSTPHSVITRKCVQDCVLMSFTYRKMDISTIPEYEIEYVINETIRKIEKKGYLVVGERR